MMHSKPSKYIVKLEVMAVGCLLREGNRLGDQGTLETLVSGA